MRRFLAALAVWLGLSVTAAACLWDTDTPKQEALGLPEVVAAITGRFPRNPPLYYEMRLARVSALLKDQPDDLGAYDDAGVACDRLGRGEEAIAWMKAKRTRLEGLDPDRPDVKEHRYRYHANLGTFLVHEWSRKGRDRSKIEEVKNARDEIARSLEINPNAHFGREKWQLKAMDWIIDPPPLDPYSLPNLTGWPNEPDRRGVDPKAADDAVRGLAGLVVLGQAWESVDIFQALSIALTHDSLGFPPKGETSGRGTLANLAWLRARELVDAGRVSVLPDAPSGPALKRLLAAPPYLNNATTFEQAFRSLRKEADAWQDARTAFMLSRLREGRHPDTDPKFWEGYRESPAPALPDENPLAVFFTNPRPRDQRGWIFLAGLTPLLIAFGILWAVRRRRRKMSGDRRPGAL